MAEEAWAGDKCATCGNRLAMWYWHKGADHKFSAVQAPPSGYVIEPAEALARRILDDGGEISATVWIEYRDTAIRRTLAARIEALEAALRRIKTLNSRTWPSGARGETYEIARAALTAAKEAQPWSA